MRLLLATLTIAFMATLGTSSASATVTATYLPLSQDVKVTGDAGNDSVTASCPAATVLVNGIDTGGPCVDVRGFTMDLGDGTNTVDLSTVTPAKFTNLADRQRYVGGSGVDTYTGVSSSAFPLGVDDVLDLGGGNDVVHGTPGDDEITGGPGNNTVEGGTGEDTVIESAATGGALFSPPNLFFGSGLDRDNFTSIEEIQFTGGPGADTIGIGSFPGRANISGGGGSDTITGSQGGDWIEGEAGDDTIHGGDGVDNLRG